MEKKITDNDIFLKNSSKDKKERKIDVIKSYIFLQPEKLKKLSNIYNKVNNLFTEYSSITQTYINKLKELSIKIKLDEENEEQFLPEEQLFNIIKAIILFNSESLNEIITDIRKQIITFNNENFQKYNDNLNILSKNYFTEINKVIINQKKYEKEMQLYEELLITQEMENKNEEKIITNNNINEVKRVIDAQENYFKSVKDSNNILKKIINVSSEAKNELRKKINEKCFYIIDTLIFFTKKQNENYELQKINIKDTYSQNKLKLSEEEELNKHFLYPIPYSLKSLNMYIKKKEKKNKRKSGIIENNLFLSLINDSNLEKEKKLKNKIRILKRDNILNILDIITKNKIVLSSRDEKIQKIELSKKYVKQILIIMFKEKDKYNNELKNKLFKSFEEDKENIMYFFKILNNHRSRDVCILIKDTFNFLGEAFKYITKISLVKRDVEIFKLLFILSLTYFYKENNNKKYLFIFIKDFPEFKEIDFWENYYENFLNFEIKNSPQIYGDINEHNKTNEEIIKEKIEKYNIALFSNLLMIIHNMVDFQLDKDFISKLIFKINDKYKLTDEQLQQVNIYLDEKINEITNQNINNQNEKNDEKDNKKNADLINGINIINENKDSKNEINGEIKHEKPK